jgi:hypothetical protein
MMTTRWQWGGAPERVAVVAGCLAGVVLGATIWSVILLAALWAAAVVLIGWVALWTTALIQRGCRMARRAVSRRRAMRGWTSAKGHPREVQDPVRQLAPDEADLYVSRVNMEWSAEHPSSPVRLERRRH